ncbi:hypothetical protein M427DRAFT_31029 [Gonapodya prolifera JEL478]|uniref:Uncharacterized protein n=1 Tax=Gonapodya prolifera (strain JEL478) TaxID=1344416 RepID=A0A139AIH2_GONPJ|nr:hypothetical protein M427DRAFT_31029 [Gonapodya prolifera JEL478]|eukprot:KXS16611.1 hypothetical protein M427DRAFT_31029 [Gonapodya prolifera JEL478]
MRQSIANPVGIRIKHVDEIGVRRDVRESVERGREERVLADVGDFAGVVGGGAAEQGLLLGGMRDRSTPGTPTTQMAEYEDVWAGTWASTNEEDTNAIDEALQIQGVGWVIRKAATIARPQPVLKSYVKDGTMYLELTRTFMGMSSTSTWPVDGIEFERDEPIMGKIKLTVAKKDGMSNVLVIAS